ncbi:hypothetical protein BOTBODRAFT_152768 [Botryobasidium botryosum FD-172 SS1]|uniref:Wax synthase domain-containing protein n=1 Tax=Botryobasidium botryosum (strain FD-172 SS1) TaxID=930990 RepID=A0A067N8L3_BOTB1|nr:hypothetical protein BOTBODRAFT_152768 [Botryobasidium botryosum FD-172 SS1]
MHTADPSQHHYFASASSYISRFLLPSSEYQKPITRLNWAAVFIVPHLLTLLLGLLVRKPNATVLRCALLPFVLGAQIHILCTYRFKNPAFWALDFAQSHYILYLTVLSAELGIIPEGRVKLAEVTATTGNEKHSNGVAAQDTAPLRSFYDDVLHAIEIIFSSRGIGWKFGTGYGLHVPPGSTVSRSAFLFQTATSFLSHIFILDFIESCCRSTPIFDEGRLFISTLPPHLRYTLSAITTLAVAAVLSNTFSCIYEAGALVGVGLLGQPPSSWPPLFDHPYTRDTLQSFWGRGWHQLLRQTFFVIGGFPLQKLFGLPGLLVGTFLGSGLFHYWGLSVSGKGTDWRIILFFLLQAFWIALERGWKVLTGRKAGGMGWRISGFIWIIATGQLMADVWISRLYDACFIPPQLSPTRRYILPFVFRCYAALA